MQNIHNKSDWNTPACPESDSVQANHNLLVLPLEAAAASTGISLLRALCDCFSDHECEEGLLPYSMQLEAAAH